MRTMLRTAAGTKGHRGAVLGHQLEAGEAAARRAPVAEGVEAGRGDHDGHQQERQPGHGHPQAGRR